ncbi:MAG: GAF domain-containing protein [Anaerolineales bacterium]|nr:GAF domain-containing protein [Anaerolineales bacterium]
MRKLLLSTTFLITLLTNSCGTSTPTPTSEPPSPASFPAPQADASPIGTFLPNTSYSQNIRFEHLSLEEGLSQSVVNVILQDRMGFLWVGTEDGLNRYDGYDFKVYKPDADDPNSLSDRWITSLAEDTQGYLWVGTRLGGLNRYDPVTGKFTRFMNNESDPQSLGNNQISALLVDEEGMWVGTDYGLDYLDYETNSFTHYRSNESPTTLSSNLITNIFKDSSGTLWVGTLNAGVNVYNEKNNTFQAYKYNEDDSTSLSNNRVLSIGEGKGGGLWVGTANGLNRFEVAGKYFTRFQNSIEDPNSLSGNTVYAIYQDRSGGLWIGTHKGLDRYDVHTNKFIHHQYQANIPNSLGHDVVYSIYEDTGKVLWVGTYGGGLNKYNRQQDNFRYYRNNPNDPNTLSGNFVIPIIVDINGIVWIGTHGAGLNSFDPLTNQFTHYRHDSTNSQSISSDDILSLQIDHEGTLWIGTNRGLDKFDPATSTFIHHQPDQNDPNTISGPAFSIYEDSDNNLWIGTNKSLDIFNRNSQLFTHYGFDENDPNSFNGNQVNVIFEDTDHSLWVGTFDDGLKRIQPEKAGIIQYKNDSKDLTSLGNDSILSIYQDLDGTLWIGTAGGGLNRYNPETDSFTRFTEKEGLPNDVIYGILEDQANNLWLSTNFGLSRFNTKTKIVRNFTASDGLQSNEFNQNAFAKDQNGNLYFGGISGLNIFLPEEIKDNPQPPRVVLTSITQDSNALNKDRTTEYLQDITLAWPQDEFEFEFAAFAYGQPSKNQYSYTLEGFDSNWKNIGNQRNGRYTNLPGGTYILRLRGSNSDGTWNQQGQSIKVTVIPPYWEMWWFRSLVAFVLVTAIAGGYRWRVKSVEGRNRELERLVQRRTSDLAKRTSEIEALYEADEQIIRNVTLNQVFQTLVDVSISMLKADRSVVFVWNEEEEKIMPRVSRGFDAKTLFALNFEEGEGMVGRAMKTGEPVIVSDLKLNTLRGDIQTVIRSEGIQSFAHFPIVVDGKVLAIFNVAYTRPNALNDDAIRLFTALVNRASLSIANMELFEQTKDLAVMEERNRLARDLHDSAKQKAFAALAQLGTANGILASRPDKVKPHLTEAETLVYEVIQELTFLIQEIYPIALQEKGLPTTLREYIFEWENRNDTDVNLTVRNERALSLEIEQAIYRLIQEALANVARHGKARRVDVSLVYNPDSLQVLVADDGCGFDMNQKAKGMGFRSMRERIGSIRGTIQVQSAPGQGTRLIAQLPIKS